MKRKRPRAIINALKSEKYFKFIPLCEHSFSRSFHGGKGLLGDNETKETIFRYRQSYIRAFDFCRKIVRNTRTHVSIYISDFF